MAILNSNLIKKTSTNNKSGPLPNQTTSKRVIDPNQFKTAVSTAVAIHINNQKSFSSRNSSTNSTSTTGGPVGPPTSRSTSPTTTSTNSSRSSSPTTSRSSSPTTGGPPAVSGDLTNDEEGIIAGITAIVMLLIKTIIKQKMGDLIILDESDRKHKQCKQLIEQEYSEYKDDDLKQVIYTSYDNENCYGMLVTKKRTDTGQLIDESIDNIVVPINKLNNSESNAITQTDAVYEKRSNTDAVNDTNGAEKNTKDTKKDTKGAEKGTKGAEKGTKDAEKDTKGAVKTNDDKSLQIAVAVTNLFKDRFNNESLSKVNPTIQDDISIATSVAIAAVLAK